MHRDLRIVFMGTPDFAVPSLDILIQNKYTVVGVVTAPDKPAGRGQHLHQSAIKKYAVEKGLPVLQPEKLKDENFISELQSLNANLFIIVAFRMLPEKVWDMPEYGTFNLHASLLPQYRGAAPINWAVINGEKETGATTFFLQHEIDTGNILFTGKMSIGENDTAGIVHDQLMQLGSQLVLKTVIAIEENSFVEKSQEELIQHSSFNIQHSLKHAPKIFKEDCKIDWSHSAVDIHNRVRGLSPYPTAFTFVDGKMLKIFSTRLTKEVDDMQQDQVKIENMITDNKTFIRFKCEDGYIDVMELQLEGKKRMKTVEFLRGHKFN